MLSYQLLSQAMPSTSSQHPATSLSKSLSCKQHSNNIISLMYMMVLFSFISILTHIQPIDAISSVAVSNDSKIIVSGSKDKTMKVFSLQTREELYHFAGADFGMSTIYKLLLDSFIGVVGISEDNKLIISRLNKTSARIFDLHNGLSVKTLHNTCTGTQLFQLCY